VAYSSALKVEIAGSFETSMSVCQNTQLHKADDISGFFYALLLCSAFDASFFLVFVAYVTLHQWTIGSRHFERT
jgi:hypothetical protein